MDVMVFKSKQCATCLFHLYESELDAILWCAVHNIRSYSGPDVSCWCENYIRILIRIESGWMKGEWVRKKGEETANAFIGMMQSERSWDAVANVFHTFNIGLLLMSSVGPKKYNDENCNQNAWWINIWSNTEMAFCEWVINSTMEQRCCKITNVFVECGVSWLHFKLIKSCSYIHCWCRFFGQSIIF